VSYDVVERRRHPRYIHSDSIEFCFDPSGAGTTHHGISLDISDSGIGLYTLTPLYEKQNITFKTTLPVPSQKATVMWVQKQSQDSYRAGLRFLPVTPEPSALGRRVDTGARILILDDEECIRYTYESFLSDEGYDVTTVCNYPDALAAVDQEEFDLIFVDVILEGRSGLDLVKKVKDKNMGCPVVLITGAPTDENASEAFKMGVFDYIAKPVLRDTLLQVTRAALSKK
jgi:CheY-like chemotaxis protein